MSNPTRFRFLFVPFHTPSPPSSCRHVQQDQARRKKMSRAHDGILKYMLKMMEVCKAQVRTNRIRTAERADLR